MLILRRRTGEEIVLQTSDGEVVITVLSGSNGHASLGIEAPESVVVLRRELVGRGDARAGDA